MTKYIVDLYLDGYPTQAEQDAAALVFIYNQLNHAGSGVKVERYNEGWISVNDQLPPNSNDVLVIRRKRNGKQFIRLATYSNKQWCNALGYTVSRDGENPVVYWMPLPLPPTQE